jgi:hypothetical protein
MHPSIIERIRHTKFMFFLGWVFILFGFCFFWGFLGVGLGIKTPKSNLKTQFFWVRVTAPIYRGP